MPKAKKIAPSPSRGNTPYQALPAHPPSAPSGESSSSRGRQKTRVYTQRACQNCQIKKTKCSGQPAPCSRCTAEHVACVFDTSTDHRRREASAWKEEEKQKIKDTLDQLIELLGSTDEQKLGRVREMVREGAGWENVYSFLEQMKSTPAETNIEADPGESSKQARQHQIRTPVAFDEWIAEVFGSGQDEDYPMD